MNWKTKSLLMNLGSRAGARKQSDQAIVLSEKRNKHR